MSKTLALANLTNFSDEVNCRNAARKNPATPGKLLLWPAVNLPRLIAKERQLLCRQPLLQYGMHRG